MHGFPGDDARGLQLDSGTLVGGDGALSIDGVSERVNDSSEHALADGNINDGASSLDDITFLDLSARKAGSDAPRREWSFALTYRYPR